MEAILNEKGSAGAGDHEYFVKWKHWPVPTWQPASSIKESVDHEVMKWESVRKEKGWPKIDEAASGGNWPRRSEPKPSDGSLG